MLFRLSGFTAGAKRGGSQKSDTIASRASDARPVLTSQLVSKNVPEGTNFVTTVKMHLESERPVNQLVVTATGDRITDMNMSQEHELMTMQTGERGSSADNTIHGYRNTLQNPHGNITLVIKSATPQDDFHLRAEPN